MALWTGIDNHPANAIPMESAIVAIPKEILRSALGICEMTEKNTTLRSLMIFGEIQSETIFNANKDNSFV